MQRKLANIISIVFHPLLIATLLMATLYMFAPSVILPVDSKSILPVLGMIFILTYIIPLMSVAMLKMTKSISSIRLEIRKERILPFSFITAYYGLTTYFFISKPALGINLMVIFGSITATILLVTLISTFYKISVHTAGTGGYLGFLVAFHFRYLDSLLFWPIIFALLLHGILTSSRLYLNSHSPQEVHLGALLGFVINCGAVYFLT